MNVIGTHLLLDGYVAASTVFSEENILKCVDEIIKANKMEYLGDPIIKYVELNENKKNSIEDDGGISVIVPITTSHISFHCWPLRNLVMGDIFSCKQFDENLIINIVKDYFNFTSFKHKLIIRLDPAEPNYNYKMFPWFHGESHKCNGESHKCKCKNTNNFG